MTQAAAVIERMMPDFERLTAERRAANAEIAGNCPEHGEYTRGEYLGANGHCPACYEREQARQERALRQSQFVERSGVPLRFQRHDLLVEFVPPTQTAEKVFDTIRAYAENFPAHYEAGRCLVMAGRTGTGKTMLACALARYIALKHGKSCRYTTAYHIVRDIKDTYGGYGGGAGSERDIVRGFVEPALLIVDEVGVQYGTDAEKLLLFEVLNGRYEALKPSIIISNEEQSGIAAFLGDRVMDRLRENGGAVLVFDWKSHRGRA